MTFSGYFLFSALLAIVWPVSGAVTLRQQYVPKLPGTRQLHSDRLAVEVMDPEAPDRYNQGVRFSPVANILRVSMDGQDFLYAPIEHNPITQNGGLAMEFDIKADENPPPGFQEASWGEGFLKVGVGILARHGDAYDFYAQYPLLEAANTTAEWGEDRARFHQDSGDVRGYAYSLDSEVLVVGNEVRIHHRLTNAGERSFTTINYAHNFFRFDGRDCGPGDYVVEPHYGFYAVTMNPPMKRQGNSLVIVGGYLPELPVSRTYVFPFDPGRPSDEMVVRHPSSGMSVEVETSPNSGYSVIHAEPLFISPEQFIRLELEPGESAEWTRVYRFECDR
ncbi:hypothetical protein [Puniceicoccus vermicola]|uniref:Uncharacterized protein n=1 Tax=Puniceicoccus vermicola TaxID=388746 RepID=A0A7X1AZI5_9BACT|nr:hypothetical protein [Puniceicoccus vermicola]MBC2602664.1 hypothetical protein [Puniceicoccus vermicola]